METPSKEWLESARNYIVDFECDCDCFRCIQDEHHDDCDVEYFNDPVPEYYGGPVYENT